MNYINLDDIACKNCNGSALNIKKSYFGIIQLNANNCSAGFYGGTIYADNSLKTITIFNSRFTNNVAKLAGGAIFFDNV